MKLSKGEKPLEIEELLIELGLHDKKGRLVDRDKVCVHKEGDYIEVGQLGAYSLTFRTKFNGFYSDQIFEVQDKPIMSMYEKGSASHYLVA